MCTNMPFKIYTENKYMWALSLAIVSISISIAIGDGTETRSTTLWNHVLLLNLFMQQFSLVYNHLFVFLEPVDEPRPTYDCSQLMQGSSSGFL